MNLDFIDDWPSQSPDLSPIEMMWRILKSRVKLHRSSSREELKKAIQEEWDAITLNEINNYILGGKYHMNKRMNQYYGRNGYSTQY